MSIENIISRYQNKKFFGTDLKRNIMGEESIVWKYTGTYLLGIGCFSMSSWLFNIFPSSISNS